MKKKLLLLIFLLSFPFFVFAKDEINFNIDNIESGNKFNYVKNDNSNYSITQNWYLDDKILSDDEIILENTLYTFDMKLIPEKDFVFNDEFDVNVGGVDWLSKNVKKNEDGSIEFIGKFIINDNVENDVTENIKAENSLQTNELSVKNNFFADDQPSDNSNFVNKKNGWYDEDGATYYYVNDIKLTGIHKIGDNYYHFGQNTAQLKRGWSITLDKREYYSDSNGVMQFGFQNIDNYKYYISLENGLQKSNCVIDGTDYYFTSDGKLLLGWYNELGNTYYFENGIRLKGIHKIGDNYYHFGENTAQLKRGWSITLDKKEYYSDSNGVMQFGFQNIDGNDYYISLEEGLYKGIYKIGDNYYHFGQNSAQLKRWWSITLDKKEYFSDSNGVMQFGFQNIDGNDYYISLEEGLYKGIYKIGDNYYHFGQNTAQLKRGWSITLDKKQCYSDSNGVLKKGLQFIDGQYYMFNDDYFLANGWQDINGKKSYFYADGSRAYGNKKIAGTRYLFDNYGYLLISNYKVYIDISSAQAVVDSNYNVNINSIDWNSLWSSGDIDGIILKAGSGSLTYGKAYTVNTNFIKQAAKKCEQLGIPYGVYWYSYAEVYNGNDVHESTDEALLFSSIIRQYTGNNLKLGVYWDLEENNRGKSQFDLLIPNFINVMNQNGINCNIYANKNFAENQVNIYPDKIKWIAHYTGTKNNDNTWSNIPRKITDYSGNWSIWQYTDAGFVNGINGYVDINICR